jgi:hypothetical protein
MERLVMFHHKFIERMDTLLGREREYAEFGYFLVTREMNNFVKKVLMEKADLVSQLLGSSSLTNQCMHPNWYARNLPDWVNITSRESVRKFLHECGNILNQIAGEVS